MTYTVRFLHAVIYIKKMKNIGVRLRRMGPLVAFVHKTRAAGLCFAQIRAIGQIYVVHKCIDKRYWCTLCTRLMLLMYVVHTANAVDERFAHP